jgi:uncharacterized OsmC-like protein
MTTATAPVNNGVNTAALLGARKALADQPEAAQFVWRATSEWIHSTHSKGVVKSYFGLGAEQPPKAPQAVEFDHPETFGEEDQAVTPVEVVLTALGGCLTGGIAAVAQHRGIQLRSVKATIEGDMDIFGILGIDPEVRNGFGEVRVNYKIDADASQADIEALVAQSQKRSAVFDIVANPTNIVVSATKIDAENSAEAASA